MKNKKIIVIIFIIFIVVLAALSIFKLVSDNKILNGEITKITYTRCGGLISYEEYLACPNIEITSDLKVTLKPGSGKKADHEFVTYSISEEKYNNIIKTIKDTKFLLLPDRIENNGCMDGSGSTITITINGKEKETHIYCTNNKTYSKVESTIRSNIDSKEYNEYYAQFVEK